MEAHGWARDQTLIHTGGAQVPWVESVLVGRQELYLSGDASRRVALEEALLQGLEILPEGTSVLVDGTPRGAGPLAPGPHHIEVRHGDTVLLSAKRRARVGQSLDLGTWTLSRRSRTELALGIAASPDRAWLGSTAGVVDLRVAPFDRGGARWMWGASARTGAYSEGGRARPAGTLSANAWWALSAGPVLFGPLLGAGVAWRLPETSGAQAAPLIAPGVELRTRPGAQFAALQATVPVFEGGGQLVVVPGLSLSMGWQLRDAR